MAVAARILPDQSRPSYEELLAQLAEAKAALAAKPAQRIGLKVSEKGALCLYGLGRFPVTLYASQWERLLGEADAIRAFLKAHASELARKEA